MIDVCDVGAAHIAAMENSNANGNRYILSRASNGVATLRLLIGNEFQSQGYKITSKDLSKVVAWVEKFFSTLM